MLKIPPDWYEFKYRMHDPQTGRFLQIDPLADKYVYNSPYAFSENKVTSHVELEGLETVALSYLWRGVKDEFIALGRQIDNMFSTQKVEEKTTSTEKITQDIEQTKSVETTQTATMNFGMEDYLNHLMNTNTNEGGPSLKLAVKETVDVKDKTTTTTDFGNLKITGTKSTSRMTGASSESLTGTIPVKLGVIPNATVTLQEVFDDKGYATYSGTLSGSTKVNKTTYSGGGSVSVTGNNNGNSSTTFSVYGETSNGNNRVRNTFIIKY